MLLQSSDVLAFMELFKLFHVALKTLVLKCRLTDFSYTVADSWVQPNQLLHVNTTIAMKSLKRFSMSF